MAIAASPVLCAGGKPDPTDYTGDTALQEIRPMDRVL